MHIIAPSFGNCVVKKIFYSYFISLRLEDADDDSDKMGEFIATSFIQVGSLGKLREVVTRYKKYNCNVSDIQILEDRKYLKVASMFPFRKMDHYPNSLTTILNCSGNQHGVVLPGVRSLFHLFR